MMKFKLNDIISRSNNNNEIIAKIIDVSEWSSSYCLLRLDGFEPGWLNKHLVENYYEKIGWNKAFFDLFVEL